MPNYVTKAGYIQIKKELDKLLDTNKPQCIELIRDARAHGDLKENAEYHIALEEYAQLNRRIAELGNWLSSAQIIDPTRFAKEDQVIFGATITVETMPEKNVHKFQIVSDMEYGFLTDVIAIQAPLSQALISKKTGEVVTLNIQGVTTKYKLTKIEYI